MTKRNTGIRYSQEMKESIIKRMMPPNNESVRDLCEEFGISDATLYTWRKEARVAGYASPDCNRSADKWGSEDKFLVRGRSSKPRRREPEAHIAHAPNQVWTWDITWLDGPILGLYYRLYLII